MFSLKDVEKIAKLSSLELSTEEKEMFSKQFSELLDYFEVLNRIECPEDDGSEEQIKDYTFRTDLRSDSDVSPSQFSPYIENKFFKVPKVLD